MRAQSHERATTPGTIASFAERCLVSFLLLLSDTVNCIGPRRLGRWVYSSHLARQILRSLSPHCFISPLLTPLGGRRSCGSDAGNSRRPTQFGGEKCHGRALEQADDRHTLFQFLLD